MGLINHKPETGVQAKYQIQTNWSIWGTLMHIAPWISIQAQASTGLLSTFKAITWPCTNKFAGTEKEMESCPRAPTFLMRKVRHFRTVARQAGRHPLHHHHPPVSVLKKGTFSEKDYLGENFSQLNIKHWYLSPLLVTLHHFIIGQTRNLSQVAQVTLVKNIFGLR